jgi:hypothetical protein
LSLTIWVSLPTVLTPVPTLASIKANLSYSVELPMIFYSFVFGICFICSPCCVTMDQTHKVKQVILNVFGPSYDKQILSGRGYATPMISGTEHTNEWAACPLFLTDELKTAQTGETFGFGFRHVLGVCMHCALWTCLDILTACLVLAQYQAAPGLLHF